MNWPPAPTRGRIQARPAGSALRDATPWLFTAFLVLMSAAWVVGSPPGSPPDEPAHYVKALGAGRGDLYGEPTPGGAAALKAFLKLNARQLAEFAAALEGPRAKQSRWQARTTRTFSVPAGLGFSGFVCTFGRPDLSASCVDRGRRSVRELRTPTHTGTYQPYLYVPPGLLMHLTRDPGTAMRLGRLALAAISLGLLVVAALLLWDRGRGALSLAGLFLAVTPAVVYFASTLNPSGTEIAAAICFCAALLRLTRPSVPHWWVWAALAASGVVLALSRSLGPAFACVIIAAVALLVGPRRLVETVRASPRQALAALLAVGLASTAGLVWELVAQPHPSSSVSGLIDQIWPSVKRLDDVARQAVGAFGKLDVPLPWPVPLAWMLALAALFVTAMAAVGRRRRRSLSLVVLLILAATVVVSVVFSRTGFDIQGRYVLPLLVVLPLVAGEASYRARRRRSDPRDASLVLVVATLAGLAHLTAWWVSARRFAVGTDGPLLFIGDAEWTPPGGWTLWTLVVAGAAGCCLLAGVGAARAVRATGPRRPSES